MAPKASCPVCAGQDVAIFADIRNMPVFCNVLHGTKQDAVSTQRGDIRLGFCEQCGHIFNTAFDASLVAYTPAYENSLHYSSVFNEYAVSMADRLIQRHNLRHKHVVDVGCGQGDFLKLLCERGRNTGTGFDPSYDPHRSAVADRKDISVLQEYYGDGDARVAADLVCCRHVLEHIETPQAFIRTMRDAMRRSRSSMLFLEVPNALYTIQRLAIWDLIYEHVSYFTRPSLHHLIASAGYTNIHLDEAYDGQYLTVEAGLGAMVQEQPSASQVQTVRRYVRDFAARYDEKRQEWKDTFARIASKRLNAVIWGAGSKGVTILNALGIEDEVRFVVDMNPRKHGQYTAGTGHEIVAPSFLQEYHPDVVIVMNDIYLQEIKGTLNDMGLDPVMLTA